MALLLTGLVLLSMVVVPGSGWRYAIDVDVYREGARALLAGQNLYTQDYQVGGVSLPFTYPPLAAMLFTPLAVLPYRVGMIGLLALTTFLMWWCLTIVLRRLGLPRVTAVWLLPFALLAEPAWETLGFGQVNVILMAMVIADTLTRSPRLPRGVLIGLAAAIKLTPAVFVLVYLVRRDWRASVTTVASGIGFTLLAAVLSPANSLTYWRDTLTDTGRIGGESYSSNQSVRGVLARLAEPGEEASTRVWFLLVLLTVGLIVLAMHRVHTLEQAPGPETGLVLLASMVALLASPVSWSHHWVWLVPTIIVLAASRRPVATVLAGLTTAAVAVAPHWRLPHNDGVEQLWPWWGHLVGNSYVLLALAVVVTTIVTPQILAASSPKSATSTKAA